MMHIYFGVLYWDLQVVFPSVIVKASPCTAVTGVYSTQITELVSMLKDIRSRSSQTAAEKRSEEVLFLDVEIILIIHL